MRKSILCLFMLFILLIIIFFFWNKDSQTKESIPQEYGTLAVYFCPADDCEGMLLQKIQNATETIHCAFYNINIKSALDAFQKKSTEGVDVRLVVDVDHRSGLKNLPFIFFDTRSALMHNKFCIFDGKEVMTGSMNPTMTDTAKNNNNILFIQSKYLAQNYEEEFQSFLEKDFGRDTSVRYPKIFFNDFLIENYFCPEDACEERILDILGHANASIYFMEYSFTSDTIGSLLLEKSAQISVGGIFEKQQSSSYSEYWRLQDINVTWDTNSALLHHKVFLVDEQIVITGSMNPSKNGNEQNDENILIIHDSRIAQRYLQEFHGLFS